MPCVGVLPSFLLVGDTAVSIDSRVVDQQRKNCKQVLMCVFTKLTTQMTTDEVSALAKFNKDQHDTWEERVFGFTKAGRSGVLHIGANTLMEPDWTPREIAGPREALRVDAVSKLRKQDVWIGETVRSGWAPVC